MIPIYRAKKIDSDEWVEGIGIDGNFLIIRTFVLRDWSIYENIGVPVKDGSQVRYECEYVCVDTTTLAIHFPGMLDSEGNKIFASLQEDGRGGDIADNGVYTREVILRKGRIGMKDGMMLVSENANEVKITGIKQ